MANPSKEDQYFTQLKVKYVKGLVSTASTSVATAGNNTVTSGDGFSLVCDAALEFIDSAGTTYYTPLYVKQA